MNLPRYSLNLPENLNESDIVELDKEGTWIMLEELIDFLECYDPVGEILRDIRGKSPDQEEKQFWLNGRLLYSLPAREAERTIKEFVEGGYKVSVSKNKFEVMTKSLGAPWRNFLLTLSATLMALLGTIALFINQLIISLICFCMATALCFLSKLIKMKELFPGLQKEKKTLKDEQMITILTPQGKKDISVTEYVEKFILKFPFKRPDGTYQCRICGAPLHNVKDPKTGKISKYLWKGSCSHFPKDAVVNIG